MTFDPTKPVQTRDGRPARIICTDRDDPYYPIIALYRGERGEHCLFLMKDGRISTAGHSAHDLVNIPRKAKVMVYFCHGKLCKNGFFVVIREDDQQPPEEWFARRFLEVDIPENDEILQTLVGEEWSEKVLKELRDASLRA